MEDYKYEHIYVSKEKFKEEDIEDHIKTGGFLGYPVKIDFKKNTSNEL